MKTRILLTFAIIAMTLASCSVARKVTVTNENIGISVSSTTVADLVVDQQKIRYTYIPSDDVKKQISTTLLMLLLTRR